MKMVPVGRILQQHVRKLLHKSSLETASMLFTTEIICTKSLRATTMRLF